MLLLEIKNFSLFKKGRPGKNPEDFLLKNINLKIESNEIHCLLGKNGSGKTTLAYAIMGLNKNSKTRGEIIFQGKKINKYKVHERAKRGIALAFQEPVRFEGLDVFNFLSAGKKGKSISIKKQAEEALRMVGLKKEFLQRKIDQELSGGERKRIELASVIIQKPKLMILDEPDASLDIIVYNELYDLLLKIKNKLGCSIFLITHREEAGLIADKASLIENGKIIGAGNFRKVMRQYCSREGQKEKCRLISSKLQSRPGYLGLGTSSK